MVETMFRSLFNLYLFLTLYECENKKFFDRINNYQNLTHKIVIEYTQVLCIIIIYCYRYIQVGLGVQDSTTSFQCTLATLGAAFLLLLTAILLPDKLDLRVGTCFFLEVLDKNEKRSSLPACARAFTSFIASYPMRCWLRTVGGRG